MHALIIEDEFLLALAIEQALVDLGYKTFALAATLAESIALTEGQCPDLVVADHKLTDGTGVDAVRAICSEMPIPVVFVTGSATEVREQLPQALIVDKPFTFEQLAVAVATAKERPFRHSR